MVYVRLYGEASALRSCDRCHVFTWYWAANGKRVLCWSCFKAGAQ